MYHLVEGIPTIPYCIILISSHFFQHYYVGSYRSAQAIVVIEHNSGVNNVYLSDDTATYYTLSLGDVVLVQDQDQGSFDLDFELVSTAKHDCSI